LKFFKKKSIEIDEFDEQLNIEA